MPSTICNYKNASNIFHSSFTYSHSLIFPSSWRTSRRKLLFFHSRWAQSSLLSAGYHLESALQHQPKHYEPNLLYNIQLNQKLVQILRHSLTQCWSAWCALRRLYVPFITAWIGHRMGYRSLSRKIRRWRKSTLSSLQCNWPLDIQQTLLRRPWFRSSIW